MTKRFKYISLILILSLMITNLAFPSNSMIGLAEENKEFTLYFYWETSETEPDPILYLNIWNHTGITFGTDAKTSNDFGWAHEQGILQSVPNNKNWYSIPLMIIGTQDDGFDIYHNGSTEDHKAITYDNQWNNTQDYATIIQGEKNAYAVKDGKLYTDLQAAGLILDTGNDDTSISLASLQKLIASIPTDYTTMGFTSDSVAAVTTALESANALIEENSQETAKIEQAYQALTSALDNLIFSSDLFIQKIDNYDKNSIRGMDVSSYLSIMKSFEKVRENMKKAGASQEEINSIGFKDWNGNVLNEQGFFDLLAQSGVNYIRLRIWNDPYNAAGKGYGGGNNDLEKAIEMGNYITRAGMKILIDFHLSDFWADPGKQKAPKAWKDYSVDQKVEAVSNFIADSLTKLITENNINVAMVQVGNETNNGVCGESDWENMKKIFDAGCKAVHQFDGVLAAIHFTDPQREGNLMSFADNLADYDSNGDGEKEGVDYDILASSYYPNSHGTMENINKVLADIAKKYDKYVMVAETAWANCNQDGDGFGDAAYNKGEYVDYNVTVQGQANAIRDVANAVSTIDVTLENGKKAALGFFYWEPAWIPVQSLYDNNGNLKENVKEITEENKTLWEEFGSGWASSYSAEYDPDDAGFWYGGSSMDSQAVFDFNGNPLPVLYVYNPNFLAYGAKGKEIKPDGYTSKEIEIEVGKTVTSLLPKTVTVNYNDSSTREEEVLWEQKDIDNINKKAETNDGIGSYTIYGTLTENTSFPVELMVHILPINLLTDPSFEQEPSLWKITGDGASIRSGETSRSGETCLHFWYGTDFTFSASNTTTVEKAGYYNASIYMQGLASAGTREGESLKLTASTANKQYSSKDATLGGWQNWQQVNVEDIYISPAMIKEGKNTITLTIEAKLNAEAWGTMDDTTLYLNKEDTSNDTNNKPEDNKPEDNKPEDNKPNVPNNSGSSSNNNSGNYGTTSPSNTQTITTPTENKPEDDTKKDTETDSKEDQTKPNIDTNKDTNTNTENKNTNTTNSQKNKNSKKDNKKKTTEKKKIITINKNMKPSKTKISIKKGKKIQLKLSKGLSGKVSFFSKDKKIATVSKKGIITTKKKGKVQIVIQKRKKKTIITLTIK